MRKKDIKTALEESLIALGGKKSDDGVRFISPELVIKHKKTGIKYTVFDVTINDTDPHVYVYRYYGPESNKKVYVKIHNKNFKDYEPV